MYEKQLFTPEVFTSEVLDSLEPIIYKYFDYSSFDEQQSFIDKMEKNVEFEDADFDNIDDGELFD